MSTLQQYFSEQLHFLELLEAVGITTLEDFAVINPSVVLPELHQAKRMLQLDTEIPIAPVFREWVIQALTASKAPNPDTIPLPEPNQLPVALPVVATTAETHTHPRSSLPAVRHLPSQTKIIAAEKINLLSINQAAPASRKARQQEEQSAYKAARHVPKRAEAKTYLRKKGIQHLTPVSTTLGAAIVVLCFLSTLFSILLSGYMLLNDERGWLIICLCFVPWTLFFILYLSVAHSRKCSVCRTHLFSFRQYTRHKQAHHITLLGYVLATALHILLFRWFRCPACGSAQQLKRRRRTR